MSESVEILSGCFNNEYVVTRAVCVMTAVLFGAALLGAAGPATVRLPGRSTALGRQAAGAGRSDLDAFMERVLARRDENWKKLQQYVLDERERMEVRGPGDAPIWGEVRDYTWYLQDGFFVRSPVKINGVLVVESERRKYEQDYLRRAKERDKRRGRGGPPSAAPTDAPAPSDPTDVQSFILQTRQPQFVDSAYFLRFKFEPSKYALVGHETFEGRDVLRIEYYPARLFAHEQDQQERRRQQNQTSRSKDENAAVERMLNKVSLVTIWVEPTSYQIVKYTFDNVNLEFLPAAWLVHMDDAKAVMTMSQPMPDVWLPRDVNMQLSATLAIGSFDIRYHLDYQNYRKAETSSRIKKIGGEWP
jgi:hypothetical protein